MIGLQCFDAAGNLTFSATDYLPKILGIVRVETGVAGSLTIPEMQSPLFFYMYLPETRGTSMTVTFSGGTLSWNTYAGYIVYGMR